MLILTLAVARLGAARIVVFNQAVKINPVSQDAMVGK